MQAPKEKFSNYPKKKWLESENKDYVYMVTNKKLKATSLYSHVLILGYTEMYLEFRLHLSLSEYEVFRKSIQPIFLSVKVTSAGMSMNNINGRLVLRAACT